MIGSYIIVTSKSSHIFIANAFSFSCLTATVIFDFDACEYTELIKTSITAFTFSNEIDSILDTYLDPVLDKAVILSDSFGDDIKSVIVSTAESKVNEVKSQIITQLDAFFGDCAGAARDLAEIEQDGSQRILTNGLTFANLAASIQATDGVVSSLVLHWRFYFSFIMKHQVLKAYMFSSISMLNDTDIVCNCWIPS